MDEELIRMLGELGNSGIYAFYGYLGYKLLTDAMLMIFMVLGARAVWPVFKKMLED